MTRVGGRAAPIAGLAVVLILSGAVHAEPAGFVPIDLKARVLERFGVSGDTRFGALEFRGGLQLTSPNEDFGALSGLDFAADGVTLYAVADTGFWFTARLVEEDGRLTGLDRPMIAPMLDAKGAPFASKRNADAEGLRIIERDGRTTAFVSFEQTNAISRYIASPDLAHARRTVVPLPGFVTGIRRNQGLEALAIAPADSPLAGAMVAIAERSLDRAGNHRGFIIDGGRPGAFALVRSGTFDVTDAAFLPDGDLIVLERRFDFTNGPGMRLRRIAAAALKAGATVDGTVLTEADLRNQIDNMEGLAIRTTAGGETLLTIVSDDNHSMLQRTILLSFALLPPAPPRPVPRPNETKTAP